MSIVRVKPDISCVVYDATTQTHVPLTGGMEYDSDDPIVKQFGWAFGADSEREAKPRPRAVRMEQATASPGEKRNR